MASYNSNTAIWSGSDTPSEKEPSLPPIKFRSSIAIPVLPQKLPVQQQIPISCYGQRRTSNATNKTSTMCTAARTVTPPQRDDEKYTSYTQKKVAVGASSKDTLIPINGETSPITPRFSLPDIISDTDKGIVSDGLFHLFNSSSKCLVICMDTDDTTSDTSKAMKASRSRTADWGLAIHCIFCRTASVHRTTNRAVVKIGSMAKLYKGVKRSRDHLLKDCKLIPTEVKDDVKRLKKTRHPKPKEGMRNITTADKYMEQNAIDLGYYDKKGGGIGYKPPVVDISPVVGSNQLENGETLAELLGLTDNV